jgi:hypothetical protein
MKNTQQLYFSILTFWTEKYTSHGGGYFSFLRKSVLIVSSFCLCGQVCSSQPKKDILYYYQKVNHAETEIVNNRYHAALAIYDSILFQNSYNWPKDIYNALVCCLKVQKNDTALLYANQLINLGVDSNLFSKPIFNAIHSKIDFKKIIRPTLFYTIDSLYQRDQACRTKENYEKYSYKIRTQDSLNSIKLLSIINQHGGFLPDLIDVGVQHPSLVQYPINILVRHISSYEQLEDITEALWKSLEVGTIHPKFFSSLEDLKPVHRRRIKDTFGSNVFIVIDKETYIRPTHKDKLDKIDANRLLIGLEPLAEYRDKIKFVMQNDDFIFDNIGGVSVFNFKDDQNKKAFTSQLIKL